MMVLVDSFRRRWVLFFAFFLAGVGASSGSAVELQLPSVTIPAGSASFLSLTLSNGDDGPTTLVIDLLFDTTQLSLTNVVANSGATDGSADFQATPSGATLVFFGGSSAFTATTLADLEFTVTPTAEAGKILSIANGNSSGANGDADALTVTLETATITVSLPFAAHRADTNGDSQIAVGEVLRVVQLYNSTTYSCDVDGEDGYHAGPGPQTCAPHDSDYAPQDWQIDLSELLRIIQFYNAEGHRYHIQTASEDGFAPGSNTMKAALRDE